jgi:hypothetical protein
LIPFKEITPIGVRRLLIQKKLGKRQVIKFDFHLILWRLDKETR